MLCSYSLIGLLLLSSNWPSTFDLQPHSIQGSSFNQVGVIPTEPYVSSQLTCLKKPQSNEEVLPLETSSGQCFKCHDHWCFTVDCSNQYTIALIDEETKYGEEHVIQTKEDIIYVGQGQLLVSRNLSAQCTEDDPYWSRCIIFHSVPLMERFVASSSTMKTLRMLFQPEWRRIIQGLKNSFG